MNPDPKTRTGLIDWQKAQIFLPRLQMSLILLLTGCAGFLSSFLMLNSGVSQMWMRYPLAILAAYIAFLLLLRLWLALQNSSSNFNLDLGLPIDGISVGSNASNSAGADFKFGGGGDFGGAGAGGDWETDITSKASTGNAVPAAFAVSSSKSGGSGSSSGLSNLSFDGDSKELGMVILAVVAVIGGLIATFYIIYIAPALLAEILVDGALLGGLHRRVKNIERKNWLKTAVYKTLLPAILCALFFGIAGGALQIAAPDADSIGGVWKELMTEKPVN